MDATDQVAGISRMLNVVGGVLSHIPATRLSLLLRVISKPGISSTDLMKVVGVPQSSLSRHMSWLSDRGATSPGSPGNRTGGVGLIRAVPDDSDARLLRYYLTPLGHTFAKMLTQAYQPTPRPKAPVNLSRDRGPYRLRLDRFRP